MVSYPVKKIMFVLGSLMLSQVKDIESSEEGTHPGSRIDSAFYLDSELVYEFLGSM